MLLQGTFRDITQRKRAEEALRRSRKQWRCSRETTFEGVVESEAGRIVDCNEQVASMLGYSVPELRGMEIASLIPPEDRERVMASIGRGEDSVIEHAVIRKNGERIVVEAHGRLRVPRRRPRVTRRSATSPRASGSRRNWQPRATTSTAC